VSVAVRVRKLVIATNIAEGMYNIAAAAAAPTEYWTKRKKEKKE